MGTGPAVGAKMTPSSSLEWYTSHLSCCWDTTPDTSYLRRRGLIWLTPSGDSVYGCRFQGRNMAEGCDGAKMLSSWKIGWSKDAYIMEERKQNRKQSQRGRDEGPDTDLKVTPPWPTQKHPEVCSTNPMGRFQDNQVDIVKFIHHRWEDSCLLFLTMTNVCTHTHIHTYTLLVALSLLTHISSSIPEGCYFNFELYYQRKD